MVAEKQTNIPIRKKLVPSSDELVLAQDSLKYPIEGLCRLLGVSMFAYFRER